MANKWQDLAEELLSLCWELMTEPDKEDTKEDTKEAQRRQINDDYWTLAWRLDQLKIDSREATHALKNPN